MEGVNVLLLDHVTQSAGLQITSEYIQKYRKHSSFGCFERKLDGFLTLRIGQRKRYRIEVCAQGVYTESNDAEVLLAEIERAVELALNLPFIVFDTGHV